MTNATRRNFTLPVEAELDLHRLTSASGVEIGIHANGCVFAIEHLFGVERTLINQVFGSPLGSGIGRVLLRLDHDSNRLERDAGGKPVPAFPYPALGPNRAATEIAGPNAKPRTAARRTASSGGAKPPASITG